MKIESIIHNKSFQFWAFYAGLFVLSFFIFFYRFPDAFFHANFYAEDATFALKIIDKEFFGALLERFNGYYIFGLYILTGISIFFNKIIFADFISLPKTIALVSYAFLAFAATLPVLLFWGKIKKINLAILAVLSSFVPLIGWDYAVVGSIGNLKFLFSYIAFLSIAYRLLLPEKSSRFIITDIAIFVCAYTNPAVYLLFPVVYLKYLNKIVSGKEKIKELFQDKSFISALVLGLILAVQLIVVKIYGIPETKGYMDEPFNYTKTIEIFMARPYLYAIIYNFFDKLSNLWSLFLFGFFCVLIGVYGKRKSFYLFSIYSIFAVTFIFVSSRTGVHLFFNNYKMPSGPSQFFYAQNLIFCFMFIYLLQDISAAISKKFQIFLYSFVIIFMLLSFSRSGSFGKDNFMLKVGTFEENARRACRNNSENLKRIPVSLYPEKKIIENFPAELICH